LGQIIKKKSYGIIDSDVVEQQEVLYCPHCNRYGFQHLLVPREYKQGEPDTDKDLWRQCPNCKRLIEIYNVKAESELEPFIEVSTNPFDASRKTVVGNNNKVSYKDRKRLAKKQKKYRDEGGNEITDPEQLAALKLQDNINIME